MGKIFYDANWVEQLKQKCDIVSVISKYITLERKGRNYWACCPFHNEKTPSFSVNAEEQFFHCFGCKEGGNVFQFVKKIESIEYVEAIELLAKSVNMELPQSQSSEEIIKRKKDVEKVKAILEEAAKYYHEQIYKNTATTAQQYVVSRKINKKSMNDFQIGYSPSWTGVMNHLLNKGFSIKEMEMAGVIDVRGGRYYDVMAERLMFPIRNSKGEVIAFSGRALEKEHHAKYKNTVQTIVFNKSQAIYGIDKVKALKQQNNLKNIILVEGQLDVITMNQFGFSQTVATLGTALTAQHVPELKRFTDDIVICYDGDFAGQKAALRAIDILKDFNLKVVSLPDGSDPDEFLYSNGSEALQKLIDQADDSIEFKIKTMAKQMGLDTNEKKSKFVSECIKLLSKLNTKSQGYVYLNLISSLSNIPVTVLNSDLEKGRTETNLKNFEQIPEIKYDENCEKAMKFVFASLIHNKEYSKINFPRYTLLNPIYERLYDLLVKSKKNGQAFEISKLNTEFDVDNEPIINDIIYYNFDIIGNNAIQYYNDCVWNFCEYYLKQKQEILKQQYKNETFAQNRKEVLLKIQKITEQLKNKNVEEDL